MTNTANTNEITRDNLQWINEAWLAKQIEKLAYTVKTLPVREKVNGRWVDTKETKPNPHYEAALAEIEEAQRHLEVKKQVVAFANANGYTANKKDATCCKTGATVVAGEGFEKRVDGCTLAYSRPAIFDECFE